MANTSKRFLIAFLNSTNAYGDGEYLIYFTGSAVVFDKRIEVDELSQVDRRDEALEDASYSHSPLFKATVVNGEIVKFEIFGEDNG